MTLEEIIIQLRQTLEHVEVKGSDNISRILNAMQTCDLILQNIAKQKEEAENG